jgi:hypothetical protein
VTATANTITCPTWCTRSHTEGPGYAIVHEDDPTVVDAVPEPLQITPATVNVTLTVVDDEPTYICVDGDPLTADAAEQLALALMDRVVLMRTLPVGGRR